MASDKVLPQCFQKLGSGRIVCGIQSLAGQNNDVQPGEQMLMMAERFANQSFYSVSLHGQADILLGDYQPQSWINVAMSDGKDQKLGPGDLKLSLAENGLIVRSRQEPQVFTKTIAGQMLVGYMQHLSVKSGRQLCAAP